MSRWIERMAHMSHRTPSDPASQPEHNRTMLERVRQNVRRLVNQATPRHIHANPFGALPGNQRLIHHQRAAGKAVRIAAFIQRFLSRGGRGIRALERVGPRAQHRRLLRKHGWSEVFDVDILDAEGPDLELPIPNGSVLKKDIVGKDIENYDSMLVLSHFKGHPMGGYGGALKQLSIGCASTAGKVWIHSGGTTTDQNRFGDSLPAQDVFLAGMADAASAVVDYFRGSMAFVNVMKNLSVDCDCCAVAEDPCMKDIGILASLDPVAVDQACIDLIYAATDDPGQKHFIERVESLHGIHTIECAAALGVGSGEYELVEL